MSWSSTKQKVVSRSSIESEFRSLANGTAELTWIQLLLSELAYPLSRAPVIYCDNLSTTYLSANLVLHDRTKHVEIDFHFIREKVASGQLEVQFTPSNDQLTNCLTKPLPTQ